MSFEGGSRPVDATMSGYSECQDCGFVVRAATASDPDPKRWEACPDCGGLDYEFVE